MADGEGVRVEGFRKTLFARAPFYVAGLRPASEFCLARTARTLSATLPKSSKLALLLFPKWNSQILREGGN